MSKSLENAAVHDEKPQPQPRLCLSKYSRRVVLSTILRRTDRGLGLVGEKVVIGGWVKSCKEIIQKVEHIPSPSSQTAAASGPPVVDVTCSEVLMTRIPLLRSITRLFIEKLPLKSGTASDKPVTAAISVPSTAYLRVTDGSCTAYVQVVIESSIYPLSQIMPVGTSILVEGTLKQSESEKHVIELVVEKVLHVGLVDQGKYPLKKARLSSGLLRQNLHLRPRSTTIASITRIRNGLSHATHTFFQNNGFLHVHMPVITSDSNGNAGETFQVTTLLSKSDTTKEKGKKNVRGDISLENVKAAIEEKSKRIEELKRSDSNREALVFALQDLKKANELAFELEEQKKTPDASLKMEKLDFSKDYFSCPAYLSMSAGLHLESYACALSSVYTLGPIFQAKKVQTKKQLAEMWMLEANLAFAELEDAMNCSEDYLKFLCNWILENCSDDINFTKKRIDKACVDRIQSVRSSQFKRITYTEAVETLNKIQDKPFKRSATWGSSLSEEHESYLTEEIYKQPIIIYNHPKSTKPFFLRLNDDKKTVASFDIIIPKVGVLISGGQREERTNIITTRIQEMNLLQDQYEWYLDLRRHGTVKHSGFSVGLEHLVMFVIGTDDARDVIPFPRTHFVIGGEVDPQLETMLDSVGRRHLGVNDTSSSGHPLKIPSSDCALVACKVFVSEGSLQHVCHGLKTSMWVIRKSCRSRNEEFIEHKKGIEILQL